MKRVDIFKIYISILVSSSKMSSKWECDDLASKSTERTIRVSLSVSYVSKIIIPWKHNI